MKHNKLFAVLTAISLAAANSVFFAPALSAAAEEETVSAATNVMAGSVKISVVDMDTGEPLEGVSLCLEEHPNGTSTKGPFWNTSEEPVKTINDLLIYENYAVHVDEVPSGYEKPHSIFFEFDDDDYTKEYTIRVAPTSAKNNIAFDVYDWTKAESLEGTEWFWGTEEYKDYISAFVYDENGDYFTSQTLYPYNYSMHLPDGKYKVNLAPFERGYEIITDDMDIAKTAKEKSDIYEFPDKDCNLDIEVVNGKLTKEYSIYVRMNPEYAEKIKDGCKANISVVDVNTNKPLEGVKLRFLYDVVGNDVIDEWNTSDELTKNIKKLGYLQWYRVEVVDAPAGYAINKTTSFNFSEEGETKNIVIKALPNVEEPNVNIAVYDWTDLVVDPADGTYKGYKVMDPKDYTLLAYGDKIQGLDITNGDVHLPDGKYSAMVMFNESEYHHVDNEGAKARAVRKIFGKDFIIPDSISTDFEIKDGKTVGQPCLFVEKEGSSLNDCKLELNVVDGITGKPLDRPSYRVIRINEENEDNAEKLGVSAGDDGLMVGYGDMPESGKVTVEGLEPYVTYLVSGSSLSMAYNGPKPVFISFDKNGESKAVTIKAFLFSYTRGDFNNDSELTIADLVLMQKWLLAAPDAKKEPGCGDLNKDGVVDVFDLILLRKDVLKYSQAKSDAES